MDRLKFIIILQLLLLGVASAKDCQYKFSGIVRFQKNEGYFLVINEKSNSEVKFKIAAADVFSFSVYLNRYFSGKTLVNKSGEVYQPLELAYAVPDPLQISPAVNFKKISTEACEN